MSSPFQELIGLLQALQAAVEGPRNHMDTVGRADPLLPGVHMAKAEAEALLGQIPLPMDHPKWGEISGALMAAMGSIDGVIDMEQGLKQRAIDAVAALQQAGAEIGAAIQSFQQ